MPKNTPSFHHPFLMAIFYVISATNVTVAVNIGSSTNSVYFWCSLLWLFQGFILWGFAERSNSILIKFRKEKERLLQENQKLEANLSLEEAETSIEIRNYRTAHRNFRSFNNFTQKLWGKMVLSTLISIFLTLTGVFTHYLYQTNISFSLAELILYSSIFISIPFNFSDFLLDLIFWIRVKLMPLWDPIRRFNARKELNKLKRKARKKFNPSAPSVINFSPDA